MSDLEDGRYIILRAGNPFPVGASVEGEPVEDVISGGKSHIVSPSLQFSTDYACMMHSIH